jgi:hypothetical protein
MVSSPLQPSWSENSRAFSDGYTIEEAETLGKQIASPIYYLVKSQEEEFCFLEIL